MFKLLISLGSPFAKRGPEDAEPVSGDDTSAAAANAPPQVRPGKQQE